MRSARKLNHSGEVDAADLLRAENLARGCDPSRSGIVDAGAGKLAALELRLFGSLRVYWRPDNGDSPSPRVDVTRSLTPRTCELLAVLAIHPRGLTRDALTDALWPTQAPCCGPHSALTRLRKSIGEVTNGEVSRIMSDDRTLYRLDAEVVSVDFWTFVGAVQSRRRATTDEAREEACRTIVGVACRGALASELVSEWIDPIREAVRRDTINAVGALAALVVDREPRQTLELLETVLDLDPYNERLYRDMLRLHAKLGEYHAIDNTIGLLSRRLAEIGEVPTPEIAELAQHLLRLE
jgi:DNA-binding SARP family transcriptional activator